MAKEKKEKTKSKKGSKKPTKKESKSKAKSKKGRGTSKKKDPAADQRGQEKAVEDIINEAKAEDAANELAKKEATDMAVMKDTSQEKRPSLDATQKRTSGDKGKSKKRRSKDNEETKDLVKVLKESDELVQSDVDSKPPTEKDFESGRSSRDEGSGSGKRRTKVKTKKKQARSKKRSSSAASTESELTENDLGPLIKLLESPKGFDKQIAKGDDGVSKQVQDYFKSIDALHAVAKKKGRMVKLADKGALAATYTTADGHRITALEERQPTGIPPTGLKHPPRIQDGNSEPELNKKSGAAKSALRSPSVPERSSPDQIVKHIDGQVNETWRMWNQFLRQNSTLTVSKPCKPTAHIVPETRDYGNASRPQYSSSFCSMRSNCCIPGKSSYSGGFNQRQPRSASAYPEDSNQLRLPISPTSNFAGSPASRECPYMAQKRQEQAMANVYSRASRPPPGPSAARGRNTPVMKRVPAGVNRGPSKGQEQDAADFYMRRDQERISTDAYLNGQYERTPHNRQTSDKVFTFENYK